MKRNWDLVRNVLLGVEALGDTQSSLEHLAGTDDEALSYHIQMLINSGLIEGVCTQGIDGPLRCAASALTWEGHEFLDKIRANTMWNKIKGIIREKSLPFTLDAIKATAGYVLAHAFK